MTKDFRHQTIRERKDRKENPYIPDEKDIPLEDDYSEESDADSVCWDKSWKLKIKNAIQGLRLSRFFLNPPQTSAPKSF